MTKLNWLLTSTYINTTRIKIGFVAKASDIQSPLTFNFSAIGFNVETVDYKNMRFQVWDLGGQTSIR